MARESFKATPSDRTQMIQLPDSVDSHPAQTIIDLNSKTPGKPVPIAELDDEDAGKPTKLDYSVEEQEGELRDVSAKVQKRIDRLRYETHTERRGREEAERQRDELRAERQRDAEELARLRQAVNNGATSLATSMKAEREVRLEDAERRLAQAHADGDSAAIARATRDISTASAELTAIAARTPQQRPQEQQPERREQPRQQGDNLHPEARDWINRNPSFERDPAFRARAMSVHYALESEGIRPGSGKYAQELDKRLGTGYSDNQSGNTGPSEREAPRRSNSVEEGARDGGMAAPKLRDGQVALTQFQVDFATKHKIPLEKMAEQVRRQQSRNGA